MAANERVKLVFWGAGIVSGLLLILYLPVLIWSPPWGDNGHYVLINRDWLTHLSFRNGTLKSFSKRRLIRESTLSPDSKSIWKCTIIEGSETIRVRVIIVNSNIELLVKGATQESRFVGAKTSNPFTIWRIKWLEWMS